MKTLEKMILVCLLFISFGALAQTDKDNEILKDADRAKDTLIAKDSGLEKFFDTASGYAIFPNVGKGGLIVGGASGNGVLYENGKPVGMTGMKKLNIGLQAGGQAVTQVIFFETDAALAKFKEGNFEFSAEASAVILDEGKAAEANYDDGVVIFAMPKAGLMADASVGGQKFEYHPFK
ncbi:lipid-binding SYLF domain-containing protein [Confluentibacter flavum]|uniref:Ysc84 actin-binding domain-containing protein n=1 Tax=Confluentibacter flavum TaxID=1909700 RepID=A0A2N3HJP2_9FLAO|nr:lipid-binding SYLF domain-containing protein [Confluentibacter flavum]PKQ45143.1 hypothetical protein CSW08_09655 [Confluentibacter flavum]